MLNNFIEECRCEVSSIDLLIGEQAETKKFNVRRSALGLQILNRLHG